jgi:minimal CRISPR polymerase domain
MNKMLYFSYDGDGCGKKVGRAIMANDEVALHEWSAKIDLGHEIVNHWVAEHGGERISGGGDEGSFKLPTDAAKNIEQLRKDYFYATGITISVGIGHSLSEAGRSLLAAKFRGKDQVAYYGKSVERDISTARKKVKKGKASQEEYKLAEAYLEKGEGVPMANEHVDCPFCEASDGLDPTHCKYCHDNKAAEGESDCPFCAENGQTDDFGNPDHSDCPFCTQEANDPDDCPFCKDDAAAGQKQPEIVTADDHGAQQQSHIQSPDSQNSKPHPGSEAERADYSQMGMNPPQAPAPSIGNDASPVGLGSANPMDNTAGAPVEPAQADPAEVQANDAVPPQGTPIPEEGAHSKEQLVAIADQIASETPEGKPDEKQEANAIDDTAIVGDNMEGNVSRPGNYEENTPGDMGLDDDHAQQQQQDDGGWNDPFPTHPDHGGAPEDGADEPNLGAVMKESLDSQSGEIQKDKVRQIVGTALQGFKAQKEILERAKEQAPAFYQANIQMLAAMIQMAEMLGLSGPAATDPAMGQNSPAPTDEWAQPFAPHPDHGGAPGQPGKSPSKEEGGAIGQPIGKLPSKATKHVARTPLPPGAINAKGQQKVIDPKTGDVRFIDRKQGMVQSPTGVPIKPPGRGTDEQPKN